MKNILALIRFSHTLFALPFALLGMLMAYRMPPLVTFHWRPILGILLCMVAARSAAMAFNRLLDRKIDAANPRTAGRHLPQGILRVGTVALFTLLCAVGFVASTLLFLPNRLPLYFALPVLAFLLAYSWTKRFTWLSHLWLGTALALSPWGAWVAIRGEIWALPPILLAAAVACWVTGFDIIYACQDYDFDKQSGLRSIPSRFGLRNALRIAAVAHFTMLGFLLAVGVLYAPFGWIWYAALGVVALLLVWEHRLVSPEDLDRADKAFFQMNVWIGLILLVVGSIDLFF